MLRRRRDLPGKPPHRALRGGAGSTSDIASRTSNDLHVNGRGARWRGAPLPVGPPATVSPERAARVRHDDAHPTTPTRPIDPTEAPLLVFDFDGVLCDSLAECMMVAWYAHAGEPLARFVAPGLDGVPARDRQRFERCRPFMRHLGHFFVPLVEHAPAADDPRRVRRRASTRSPATTPSASSAPPRPTAPACAPSTRAHWHACHTVELRLGALASDAYIATARDRDRSRRSSAGRASRSRPTGSSARCATRRRRSR